MVKIELDNTNMIWSVFIRKIMQWNPQLSYKYITLILQVFKKIIITFTKTHHLTLISVMCSNVSNLQFNQGVTS